MSNGADCSGAAGLRPDRHSRGWRQTAVAAALATATLLAGAGSARAENGEWEFSVTPYLWMTSLSAEVDSSVGPVDTSSDFSNIVTDLNFAFMLTSEAHNGEWGILVDLLYVNITSEESTPRDVLFSKAVVDTVGYIGSFYGEYRALKTDNAKLDLLAGFRVFSLELDVALKGGRATERKADTSSTWVDPVIGVRGRYDFDDSWFAMLSGDVGGFGIGAGNDMTWQVVGTVGYVIDDSWSVAAGYRWLALDRDIDNQRVKLNLYGPIIGATYRF